MNTGQSNFFLEGLRKLSSVFALVGGAFLVLLVFLVFTSIVGRTVFSRPIPGDFEIVGIGTAISVFLFLPYCYLEHGNVVVDIFFKQMPPSIQRLLDAFASFLFGIVASIFSWQMLFGLADTIYNKDISMIVGVPLWIAYPFGIASFSLLAIACFYNMTVYLCDRKDG